MSQHESARVSRSQHGQGRVSTYCVYSEAVKAVLQGGLQAGRLQAAAAAHYVLLRHLLLLQQLQRRVKIERILRLMTHNHDSMLLHDPAAFHSLQVCTDAHPVIADEDEQQLFKAFFELLWETSMAKPTCW